LVAFDGLVIGGATWPLETAAARPPAVYSALVPAPGRRQAVLDLPTDAGSTMATSRYLFWQGHHGLPIPYAVDARASTSPLLAEDAFRTLAALSQRRPDEAARLGVVPDAAAHPRTLGWLGVRWIVLHTDLDPEAAPRIQAALERHLGPGTVVDQAVWWDLGEETEAVPRQVDALRRSREPPRF
jgi:hypothetical protein